MTKSWMQPRERETLVLRTVDLGARRAEALRAHGRAVQHLEERTQRTVQAAVPGQEEERVD